MVMPMKSQFTEKAQGALGRALELAREMGHTYIGSEHLLLGLLGEESSAAGRLLYARGADFDRMYAELAAQTAAEGPSTVLPSDMTPRTRRIIEASARISAKYMQNHIGTEHILLAICEDDEGAAARLIERMGMSCASIRSDIAAYLESISAHASASSDRGVARGGRELEISGAPTLSKYGRDLTRMAEAGMLDPTIGRESETERVIQILCRKQKNNPCLIGEPGVGKTAVVEGLAGLIANGEVPDALIGRTLVSLDLPAMIAGAKYRGEFEDRMKNVMEELSKDPSLILFIDELHTLVGAGAAEGAVDAANILKPALARGEIRIIGATTVGEYRRHIEKDPALERRFQPINICEPSTDEAKRIIFGLRSGFEEHHGLKITDEAINAAVDLSARYLNGRFLPDKAIDLIDEAAAGKRIRLSMRPGSLRDNERKLRDIKRQKENAILSQDFEGAAALRNRELELRALCDVALHTRSTESGESVCAEDIAEVVTRWTGIPVRALSEDESERLSKLDAGLGARVFGQNEAIAAASAAIRRSRLGISDPDKPIGSFIFAGPGGVGKTELCRALAEELFGSQSFLVRFDMSEYMEKQSVSRLIGSPPGYVGYDDGGQLTERVRRMPYCVVLFDEIEKAHGDIFNILLQLLEDGRLTDSQGRTVDFRNTVIIMTSNIGAGKNDKHEIGFDTDRRSRTPLDVEKKHIRRELLTIFRPELLDRFDEIVVFRGLGRDDVQRICVSMLERLRERCRTSAGIELNIDEKAIACLCDRGYATELGARPLRRVIQKELEEPLSELMLGRRGAPPCRRGDILNITADENNEILITSTQNGSET